jgi:hypothetical protein
VIAGGPSTGRYFVGPVRSSLREGASIKIITKVPFDFPELIASLAPCAFFTNSPLHDANFEVAGVRFCLESARQVDELLLGAADHLVAVYPDAGHDFPRFGRFQTVDFLDRILGNAR